MKTLLAMLLLLSSSAFAEDYFKTYAMVNVTAYHFDREAVSHNRLNESNPGIGFELVHNNFGVLSGVYRNSIYRNSLYLLVRYTPVHVGNISAGLLAGGTTGYIGEEVNPAAGLLIALEKKDISANLIIVPNVPEKQVYGFIGLQLKYLLK